MRSGLRLAACGAVLAAVAFPGALAAQEAVSTKASFTVDAELAKRGKSLWQARGCTGCHTIGKGPLAGPDLGGVLERRDLDWVKRFLTNTPEMLATDPIAQELLKQYKNTKMPDLKLKEPEVDALINFIAEQGAKNKKS